MHIILEIIDGMKKTLEKSLFKNPVHISDLIKIEKVNINSIINYSNIFNIIENA